MQGEIILTGTELMTGQVAEVNARYAGRRLHESGLSLQCITMLGDGAPLFGEVLHRALGRSRFVIITGGLGPTDDDMTVAQAADVLNLRLVQDEAMLARMRRRLEERGFAWEPQYGKMALMPRLLFESGVLPVLTAMAGKTGHLAQRTLKLFGKMEVEVQQAVHALGKDLEGIEVGFYPNFPEVHLTLTARGPEQASLEEKLDQFVAALSREVGEVLLGTDGAPLEEVVGRHLRRQGQTLAVAESCTGGLICHRLTDISGSSDYFQGGVVTYSNQAKIDLLRVSSHTLAQKGAVSADTAATMALGVKELFHADYGLAVTGIAGPTGGTPEKPVGLVFMGLSDKNGVESRRHQFPGDRDMIKTLTAENALDWLRRKLLTSPGNSG
jgi:nicotinamide-nucleotide amidase